ncbi:MAG: ATP-dependent 6-phosphofructokinase [Candidatus Aminicenantes bacterium]|nr:MAG: ATP-dependent 6-phosphofructokinase [Candidatus Aminicenantes bacterium]
MTKIKILVADNDSDYRKSLAENVLKMEGYEVFQAGNPQEAKEILKKELIHLAILDIRLKNDDDSSDESGFELSKEIDPGVAWIVLTGYPPDWVKTEAFREKFRITFADSSVELHIVNKSEGPKAVLKAVKKTLEEKFEVIPRRRIAVLTSGGDSPGMNAAIRAIVCIAMDNDVEVIGIQDGYKGLVNNLMRRLTWKEVSDIHLYGGTILGTARFPEFEKPDIREKAVKNIIDKHITGLVVIGGDGSMKGAEVLAKDLESHEREFHTIAIPGTIDNDIWGTDMSLGTASAATAMIEELRNILHPAQALRRIFLCEVMGRYCGYLALQAALGIGADAVILPEDVVVIDPPRSENDLKPWQERWNGIETEKKFLSRIEEIAKLLKITFSKDKRYGFVVLSEGVKLLSKKQLKIERVQETLENALTQWNLPDLPELRTHIMGHVVRGVAPCRYDLWLGARLGTAAVQCILNGKSEVMVGWSEGYGGDVNGKKPGIIETKFDVALEKSNRPPHEIWQDRPKWQELLEMHEALACPPELRDKLRERGNRFVQ